MYKMTNSTNQFKKWLHENYIIKPTQEQEIYNILFNDLKLKDDTRTIITYLNHYGIKTKLDMKPTIINGLGININIHTPAPAPKEQIKNYIQYMKQSLKAKDNILFTVEPTAPEKYILLRTREHRTPAN